MGKYFDFTPIKPWAGGLGDIGDALYKIGDSMRASDKQDMERAKTRAYEAQVEATNRSQRAKDMKEQVDFAQRQSDRARDLTKNVSSALGSGLYGEAEGMTAASQFEDPRHPGQMAGVSFSRESPGPAPVEPTKPVEPQTPDLPDFVQVMNPAQARAKAIHDSLMKQGRPVDQPPAADDLATEASATEAEGLAQHVQDQRGQYTADKGKFDMAQRAYDPAVQAYKADRAKYDEQVAHPNVSLAYPNGQKVTIDPREAERHKDAETQRMSAQLLDAASKESDPVVAATMRRQASMIAAQLPGADKGAVNNAALSETAQLGQDRRQGKQITSTEKIQAAHDATRLKAKGHGGGFGPGNKAFDHEETELAGELNKFETGENLAGPKGLQQRQTALQQAYNEASKADQNPGQQILILDRLLKSASGLGVRQQMLQTYLNHLGGLQARGEGQLQSWTNGTIGKQQWANVKAAIGDELSNAQSEGGDSNKKFKSFAGSPAYLRHPDLVKRRELQMYGGLHGGPGQPAPAAPAAPAQAAPPPPPTPAEDQQAIEMARARLAKNPNDAVARRVLDAHQLAQ